MNNKYRIVFCTGSATPMEVEADYIEDNGSSFEFCKENPADKDDQTVFIVPINQVRYIKTIMLGDPPDAKRAL